MLPILSVLGATPTRNTTHFTYWCLGSCDSDATSTPSGGTILMGGGTDVDDAYKQQIAWSAGGDYLVLRAHGDDAYNPYIYAFGGAHSVSTLLTDMASHARAAVPSAVKPGISRSACFCLWRMSWRFQKGLRFYKRDKNYSDY